VAVLLLGPTDRFHVIEHHDHPIAYRFIDQFRGPKAFTGEDGRFSLGLTGQSDETLLLLLHPEGGFSFVKEFGSLGESARNELPAPQAATIRGVVSRDGKPIAGHLVSVGWREHARRDGIRPAQPFHFSGRTVTDRDGRFSFTGLGEGVYGIAPVRIRVNSVGESIGSIALAGGEVVELSSGAIVTRDIQLPVGFTITGRCVDEDGRPVVDCRLDVVTGPRDRRPVAIATSDATGRFELANVPAGDYLIEARVEQQRSEKGLN
jgi:hypothetical protein